MTVWTKNASSAWTKINSIFVKTGSTTWTETLGAWIKTGSNTWTRVFTRILVPANTVLPDITGSTKLYGTLTGSLGSWTSPNGTNSYARQWQRASNSGGVAGAFSAISGATSSTYTTTDSDDNKFVCLRVTATNLSGSATAQSYEYLITKYTPVALSTYSLSGVAIVGGTLTAFEQIGTWKGTTTITGDTSPSTFEYEWSWSDGTVRQSTAFNSTNSNTYTIVSGDLGKIIRVRVTGTNSGGSDTTGYTSSGTVTSTYAFNFGNTLYVGSNGYIGLDSGGSTAASPGSGRIINIYSNDLVQYRLQEYSDSSNYYLYFRSYNYQSPLVRAANNAVDYQIKFYTGQPYCDIYIVRKGSSVPIQTQGPGYYSSGFTGYAGIPGPYAWGAGSVLRSYFNGATGSQSAFTWTPIADTLWKNISVTDIDDSFTSVVTSANQQAPILTAPTLNSVTVGPQGGSVSANFTGGSGPFYQMFWWGTASAPTSAVTPDATRSFSPLIDSTGPTSTATQYMYVRSVETETDTSVGPSSIASAWSNGIAFNMTSTDVSQNSAPTTRATSTSSTSTVKYLDSITWSAGTYTNAASITSVLLYSTVTSNLVSPAGNTLSSYRTANPYAIVPSDPAGTPYVFAVRDTVVGTNGTTYYFYSNQITSANADAVAFSYGTATSAAGGWTASVNAGTQTGASYSYVSATAGSGSVNSSTGAVTASGLSSAQSSTITVNKSVSGYNTAQTVATGTASTVVTYTLTYSANGGSTTPSAQTGASGATITLASGAGTQSGFSFGGWNIGGTTYSGGGSYTFGSANATATAIWNAVFVTPSISLNTNPPYFFRSGSTFNWGWDNASWSGSTSGNPSYPWRIRSGSSTGTIINSGTRSYTTTSRNINGIPWNYRIGTTDGDTPTTTASRWGSYQATILGTNGQTYSSGFSASV
jgi:hypothetical protein